jgi:hypothetical protein
MTIQIITKQQQTILTHLYHYRFLNRTHIQNILKHTTHNRINIWLKDLNEKGYVNRIFRFIQERQIETILLQRRAQSK